MCEQGFMLTSASFWPQHSAFLALYHKFVLCTMKKQEDNGTNFNYIGAMAYPYNDKIIPQSGKNSHPVMTGCT